MHYRAAPVRPPPRFQPRFVFESHGSAVRFGNPGQVRGRQRTPTETECVIFGEYPAGEVL